MSEGQISQLAALATFLNQPENREVNIRIEGHCDDEAHGNIISRSGLHGQMALRRYC